MTIFALGIMPYITASIILQLLTVVYEPLAKLQKEGELGRKKITQWTRYITVILSAVQSFGIAIGLEKGGFALDPGLEVPADDHADPDHGQRLHHVAGRADYRARRRQRNVAADLCRHRGRPAARRRRSDREGQERGLGRDDVPADGVPARLHGRGGGVHRLCGTQRAANSGAVRQACRRTQGDGRAVDASAAAGERRRRDAGDLRVFDSDVAADDRVRLAQQPLFRAICSAWLGWGEPLYTVLYAVGIIFFAYFYVSIVFNPSEVADNMRKYGGFIPGIRPGKRTADFINEVLTRITLVGALYLIIISFIPEWMITGIHLNHLYGPIGRFFEGLPNWVTNGLGVNFYFGGTSLLIVVGVAMDTVTQIEAQLIMRHYDGFTPRSGRIRGRRTW